MSRKIIDVCIANATKFKIPSEPGLERVLEKAGGISHPVAQSDVASLHEPVFEKLDNIITATNILPPHRRLCNNRYKYFYRCNPVDSNLVSDKELIERMRKK